MPRRPRYTFAGRYRDTRTGRFISAQQVRRDLDQALQVADRQAKALAEDYRAGRVSLNRWRIEMRRLIRNVHVSASVVGHGGREQMTPRDWGTVGATVKREYGYLERFTQQLQRQEIPADGHFLQRTTLYTQAARETYHEAERSVMQARGMEEERNVIDPGAEHCEGSGSCVEESAKGWVPVGTLAHIGARLCGRRCRCRLEFRRAA